MNENRKLIELPNLVNIKIQGRPFAVRDESAAIHSQSWKRNWARSAPRAGIAMICLALHLLLIGCEEERIPEEPVARPVKILVLESESSSRAYEYPGKVSPTQETYMAFEVAGRMTTFPVREGQAVRKGNILARLDPRDFQASLDAEMARVREAKADYQRYRTLYESESVALSELQVKRRSYEVKIARAKQAQKAIEDTKLIAPFSGIVAKKLVKDFQNVQAKEPVLILQDSSSLEIIINVPERDIAGSKPGLTLGERNARLKSMVAITSFPGRTFPARIKEFSTTADPDTRTFKATFAFDTPRDVMVLSGMTAKVILSSKGKERPSGLYQIPANAVLADDAGQPFVWIVNPATMQIRRTPVQIGELLEANVEIQSGLSRGDWVAVSGVHQLREGLTVRQLQDAAT